MSQSSESTRTLLARLPLFGAFTDDALAWLVARTVTRDYGAGHVLFATGDACRGLYVVDTGRVKIFRTSPSGREQILQIEGPGRPVAELPLFDGGPYPASAITEVESRLVFVPRSEFETLYRENADVAGAVIHELGKRLRHLVHVTETLAFRDVSARLASYLAEYGALHGKQTPNGVEFILPRTQEELSFELGTARESVSRAFKQLAQRGVLQMLPRRRVRIPDLEQLRTIGRPGERPRFE